MFGDDRVIRYTGVDDDTGDAEDAQVTEWGIVEILTRNLIMFSLLFWTFEIVITHDLISFEFCRVGY